MSAQPTTHEPSPFSAVNMDDLYSIRDLVGLVAFATEARRVLREIELTAEIFPDFKERLCKYVECFGQWRELPSNESAVLWAVHGQLDRMIERAGGAA